MQTQGKLVGPRPDSPPDLRAHGASPWEICHVHFRLEKASDLNSLLSACSPELWREVLTGGGGSSEVLASASTWVQM